MANEKGRGQAGKKWAIDAAERVLKKMERTESVATGTSLETTNTRGE